MAVPSILLAIYAALVALVLVLSSVSAHLHPPPEQIRRVSDAVERAAIAQLLSPVRWGIAGALLLSIAASIVGMQKGIPLLWTALVPVLGGLLSGVSLFLGTRVVHRAISCSVMLSGQGPRLALCAREFMAAVLLTGGAVVGLGWSVELLAEPALGIKKARFLVLLALASAGLMCALFARAATSSALTSHHATKAAPADPHGGSLAILVGSSFHFPLLVLCVWSLLAMLSHLAFLPAPTAAHQQGRILYPALLQLLGLFAIALGAWAARVTEDESPRHGWMRAGLVTWALLLIGCWSFSSQLPAGLARSTPVAMSGFFALLPVFLGPQRTIERQVTHRLGKAVSVLALLTLLVHGATRLRGLQSAGLEISTILGAGAAAALPFCIIWVFASSADGTRQRIAALAFVDVPRPSAEPSGGQLLGLVPGLGLLVAVVSLQTQLDLQQPGLALEVGLSLACGAAIAALGNYLLERNSVDFQARLGALISPQGSTSEAALDLEAANKVCEEVISSRAWLWVFTITSPSLAILLSRLVLGESNWMACGLAVGSCLFGVGHAWSTHHTSNEVQRMAGMTSLSSCLVQFLLIFLMMSSF